MKRKLIAAVAALFVLLLAGCGAQTDPPSSEGVESTASTHTPPTSTPVESESSSFSAGSETPGESSPAKTESPTESQTPTVSQQTPESTKPPKPVETIPPATESTPPVSSEPPQETQPPVTTEEPKPKTAYDFPFDMDAIKADCIAIGEGMGLQRDTSLTPDNATWWNPVTASQTSQGDSLKQGLRRYIESHTIENLAPYGMDAITYFNIYYESRGDGVYSIYFLFA